MEDNNSNGLLITFSGLFNYGDRVQETGMGQLAASQTLAEHQITTQAFSHDQVSEAYQAVSDYNTANSGAPISIAGHSMGVDAAIQLANQLGESEIPVNNLFTVSSPPAFMVTELTNSEVENMHNFYTSGQDYFLFNDAMLSHVNNYEVGETHTSIDENRMVQQYIEQTVIDSKDSGETVKEIEHELPEAKPDFSAYEQHTEASHEKQTDRIEASNDTRESHQNSDAGSM